MGDKYESGKKQERINYWLNLAQYDLDTAEAMLKTERFLYVGFMCHQVIEKTLKAIYVKNKPNIPPYSHNLSYLARESSIYSELTEVQKAFLDMLEPLNIESRYPDYKKQISESLTYEKSNILLEQTKEMHQWFRNRLLKP
jgi:HEPN domain-containing protein